MTNRVFLRSAALLPRRLTLVVAAAAVALAGFAAGSRPAKADADDILRFLAGAIVIGAIVNAIDDNQTPQYHGRWILPGSCLETIRVNGRNIDAFNARCLNRAGYDNLPNRCRYEFRVGGGHTRRGYIAECMFEAGYRVQGGGYYPQPGPGPQPGPNPGMQWLPSSCQMTYRQNGYRVDGYWASCLRDHGLRRMPDHCRVQATSGERIFNAQCLYEEGYRRGR